MSEDMSPSWKYLTSAGSRISSLKGYIAGRDSALGSRLPRPHSDGTREERQSWRAWAGQKIRVRRKGVDGSGPQNTELVNVFPGWAARRYAAESAVEGAPRPFELEVFVSGYAISYRPPENASRSQRAFIRLAKGFASLPKLVDSAADIRPNTSSLAHLTPSTEQLLANVKLPPRPTEIADDYDIDALERQLRRAKQIPDDSTSIPESTSSSSSRSSTCNSPISDMTDQQTETKASHPSLTESISATPGDVIRRLHANLEKRLQPFWSSVLPNRVVRLHLFASPHQDHPKTPSPEATTMEEDENDLLFDVENGPLASQDIITAADGSFQVRFKVKWEDLCRHPKALHIAFGEAVEEHELLIVAQLLPVGGVSQQSPHANSRSTPSTTPVPLTSLIRIPITHSPIRVISDIDDTVKFSGILSGARAVFHNVFVKDLQDNVIPGMGEWYGGMWSRGVRFHYVSNGPFELLPVLNEFFEVSRLPPGSIKLRSYAGRSLFNGLLSAPAARKRAGVVDVLDSFPDSRFFLIGDTGEQDMELYADLARERPDRILGVFVRDADPKAEALSDPTGWNAMGAAGTRPTEHPLVPRSESGMSTASSSSSTPSLFNYNYNASGSPLNPSNIDTSKTPRPNTYRFGDSSAHLKNNPLGKDKDPIYFNAGEMTTEPEPVDQMATPTALSSARMESANTLSPGRHHSVPSVASRVSAKFTSQPPKPIDPPSIKSNLNVGPSSMSFHSQQTASSGSSAEAIGKRTGSLSDPDKKRSELQFRVYRARTQMPSHVPLRVFRDPSECVEAQQILDRER